MDIAQRIAQFENMVQADPENDMAHFSLGRVYAEAGRAREAAESYLRCCQINPAMSKAYQLAGEQLIAAGDQAIAGEVLTKGFTTAATRGDRLPQKAMGELLTKLGLPVPQVGGAASAASEITGAFVCKRTGRPGSKLTRQPFRGPVGAWIFENISAQTWDEWIRQGTKVINELRLDLSRDQDAATYDQHMREYLGIDEALLADLERGKA